jgi:hypothetical protein
VSGVSLGEGWLRPLPVAEEVEPDDAELKALLSRLSELLQTPPAPVIVTAPDVLVPPPDMGLVADAVSAAITGALARITTPPDNSSEVLGALAQIAGHFDSLGKRLSTMDKRIIASGSSGGGTAVGPFPLALSANGPGTTAQPLAVAGSSDERWAGGHSTVATVISAAGDTTLVTPSSGHRLRVVWVSALPSPDNTAANRIRVRFDSSAPFYDGYAVGHWEPFDGPVDGPLIINMATSEPVAVNVHYRELP